jgi:hypothetical protein
MYIDSLVVRARIVSLSSIRECLVFIDLGQLKQLSVLPLGVAVLSIQFHSLGMVTWDLDSVHKLWGCTEGVLLRLIGQCHDTLGSLGVFAQEGITPAWLTNQIEFDSTQSNRDRILVKDTHFIMGREWFP